MSQDNMITIVGNATSDPELRFSTAGKAVCRFSVAQNERRRDENGVMVDGDTTFGRCVAFNTTAENLAESIVKGTRIIVVGRLHQNDWTPEATAEEPNPTVRTSYEIIVDHVGPDLRWASATVAKNARRSPAEGPFDADAEAEKIAPPKANGVTKKASAKVKAGEEDF